MKTMLLAVTVLVLAGCATPAIQRGGGEDSSKDKPSEEKKPDDKPKLNIRYLYSFCNDVASMRKFYSDQLGMKEGSHFDDEKFGWLTYKSEGVELMFFRWDSKLPVNENWAWQPGGTVEGAKPAMSFSVGMKWDDFKAAYKRLKEAKVRAQTEKPQWRQQSYWGWTVADPMGNTIEVYTTPPKPPKEGETPEWVD